MPAFEKKTIKFVHAGMNFNRPIDLIPEGQICFAKNARIPQQGEVTSRKGITRWAQVGTIVDDVVVPVSEINSLSRLNNYNVEVNFDYTYIIGADASLFVGKTAPYLGDGTINPVDLPLHLVSGSPVATPLSGNPLSMVDMAPVSGPTGWKYIGDSTQMLTVGYYPGDDPNAMTSPTMARCLTMGLPVPVNTAVPVSAAGSNLTGDYQWCFAFRRTFTGARSNPSAPTRVTLTSPALTLTAQGASMTLPVVPLDPQTSAADTHVVVDVYRFGGTVFRWALVGTGDSGTTFTDNLADADILTAPSPPSVTDPVTGLTRFNLYQPFPLQDIARFGDGTLATIGGTGKWELTWGSGDKFNPNWIQGTTISINNAVYTIFQVIDDTHLEVTEDCGTGGAAGYAIPEGAITAGQPLAHIWGPFSTGQTGAYIFGIGNPNSPGTLYWCNGNDPDSSDVANSLVVTAPSEPLMGGCVYDGACIIWSTERMFRAYPSLSIAGQFTVEEIPGGKGMWGPYSLAIQSSGFTDQHVTWLGKDGIYNWSLNSGLESLTDDTMYPWFIHDNQDNRTLVDIYPFLIDGQIIKPDFSAAQLKYHRITWFDGYMFYDFPQPVVDGGPPVRSFATMVYDSKQSKGWVSVDDYYLDDNIDEAHPDAHWSNNNPIVRAPEIAANNLKLGIGSWVYDYTGISDEGNEFETRFVTRAEDMGDPRMPKLWGDYMLDIEPLSNTVSCTPRTNFNSTNLATASITGAARAQQTVDFSSGLGELSATFSLDLSWMNGEGGPAILFQWQPSFVPKPDFTRSRATDWTDDGEPGDKWVYGCLIEANTFGTDRVVAIHMDGDVNIQNLTLNHNGQSTKPYYFTTPVITHQLRCVPTDSALWELFRFIPKWHAKPELTRFQEDWTDDGHVKPKYLQGFVLQGDTEGQDVTVQLWADQALVQTFTVNHDGELEKPYAVTTPPIIHEMKLIPSGNNIRYLEPFKIAWIYVLQPEFTHFTPDYTPSDPMAYHGVAIEADTQGNTISVDVVSEGAVVRTLSVNHNGRVQKAYSFLVPFYSTEMKLVPHGDWRQYPDWVVRWIAYPKPDLAALYTDWDDDGFQGAKFMQGFILRADTAGLDTTITVEYDGGQIGGVFARVNHNGEQEIAYSFPTPFIAHQLRAYPDIPIRYTQPFKIRWIWEPAPELAKNWITQTTSHMLKGWFHHRDTYIAIQSYDWVYLRIYDDAGGVNTYIFSTTAGTVQKYYEVLHPQKAKLVSYSLTSCLPFRVFQKDCEVRVAQWMRGAEQEYTVVKPFGGPHFERGAQI